MIWLVIGGLIVWGLSRLADGPGEPEKAAQFMSRPCVIENGGNYWDGSKFIKDKKKAKRFADHHEALAYTFERFSDDVAEECELEKI